MKKTLLLSVVASTMIMAGGDIAPVEPVVEAPAAAAAWNFTGNAVAYYQTTDDQGNGDLFGGNSTYGALGLQLGATNADIFAGVGAGVEVSSIQQDDGFSYGSEGGNAQTKSSALTQAYLTYGVESMNTSFKVGRQTLPKALSPFAFSEGWQVFKNTFDAALAVNSSLPDTTLVYAYVTRAANNSVGALDATINYNNDDNVHMVTVQNKSIAGLTLTGTYYNLPDAKEIMWIDAQTKVAGIALAAQGGKVSPETGEDTTAYGAKVAGNVADFALSLAYSSVGDGGNSISNHAGGGIKTPLYTQSILDQDAIKRDADTFKLAASTKALGGTVGAAYITADMGADSLGSTFIGGTGAGTYDEIDLTYKTKVGENTTVFAAYVNQNDDRVADESQNFVRFWARYNF